MSNLQQERHTREISTIGPKNGKVRRNGGGAKTKNHGVWAELNSDPSNDQQWPITHGHVGFGAGVAHGHELLGASGVPGSCMGEGGPKWAKMEWQLHRQRVWLFSVQWHGWLRWGPFCPTSSVPNGSALTFAGHVHVSTKATLIDWSKNKKKRHFKWEHFCGPKQYSL